jgi:hypothetical protein
LAQSEQALLIFSWIELTNSGFDSSVNPEIECSAGMIVEASLVLSNIPILVMLVILVKWCPRKDCKRKWEEAIRGGSFSSHEARSLPQARHNVCTYDIGGPRWNPWCCSFAQFCPQYTADFSSSPALSTSLLLDCDCRLGLGLGLGLVGMVVTLLLMGRKLEQPTTSPTQRKLEQNTAGPPLLTQL